jgi:hypothetical protein
MPQNLLDHLGLVPLDERDDLCPNNHPNGEREVARLRIRDDVNGSASIMRLSAGAISRHLCPG